ncbi:MAG: glycoside hydrolase family 25 protein [Bacteroidetes bacterium]|nr:MAG: glycoside hydrolase family 25 protein [Bacteroidota bacterium]
MDDFDVHGIDVSHYQGRIDWPTVSEQGSILFLLQPLKEEITRISIFCDNWDLMRMYEIKRGAYHFFRPNTPVNLQIANFVDNVELEAGDLPPVLDVETYDGASKLEIISGMRQWLYAIEIHYNVKPIIYTNLKFFNKNLAGQFRDYPLWIARYNTREPRLADSREWDFWQYGNKGTLAGIEGYVDFNVFQGDLESLDSMCYEPAAVISEQRED